MAKHCRFWKNLYVVQTNERDQLRSYLSDEGIDSSIHYPIALPFLGAYDYLKHCPSDFPVAFGVTQNILSLPMYPELTTNQLERILDTILQSTVSKKWLSRKNVERTSLPKYKNNLNSVAKILLNNLEKWQCSHYVSNNSDYLLNLKKSGLFFELIVCLLFGFHWFDNLFLRFPTGTYLLQD